MNVPQKEVLNVSTTPTIFVVFGITGDLARQKLLPALLDLYVHKALPEQFKIIGFSRKPYDDESFRELVYDTFNEKGHAHSDVMVRAFLERVQYVKGFYDEVENFEALRARLDQEDREYGICANKVFYLSVPPTLYETILKNIKESDLARECPPVEGAHEDGWSRILIEKPFGKDRESAERLDALLGTLFSENQIFRIDHYLAKEAVQNILAFRFSNTLFEHLWRCEYIERVHITLYERKDIGTRGTFFDGIGALRDVGQNHMLQMLALIAMEHPGTFDAECIRRERARVLEALRSPRSLEEVVRAQYTGFRESEGVATHSDTETYFRICAHVATERWEGVPFILESGKALPETKAEISIYFKAPEKPYAGEDAPQCRNRLTFRIQPDEHIEIVFWAKEPGLSNSVGPKPLSFSYEADPSTARLPDAYERVLSDAIRGDQTLFTSTEEVRHAWRFISSILEEWKRVPLGIYEKGRMPKVNQGLYAENE